MTRSPSRNQFSKEFSVRVVTILSPPFDMKKVAVKAGFCFADPETAWNRQILVGIKVIPRRIVTHFLF